MELRALVSRLRSTCPIAFASATMVGMASSSFVVTWTRARPMSLRTSWTISSVTWFRFTGPRVPDDWRAKDRSPCVIVATRRACRRMTSRSFRTSSGSPTSSASSIMTSTREVMMPMGLLISWAMPADRVPSAASLSAWRAAFWNATRSLMSVTKAMARTPSSVST